MGKSAQHFMLPIWSALVSLVAMTGALALGTNRGDGHSFRNAPLSRLSGVHFAVSDFDGDRKPDLASVETTSLAHANGNYTIRFQFSAAAQTLFRFVAPIGGIRVSALDVNGDSLTDLVVSSVLDERIVVILVNHGQGRFSLAEPSLLAGVRREAGEFFHALDPSVSDSFTVASLRYSFDGDRLGRTITSSLGSADSVTISQITLSFRTNLNTSLGRSPPILSHENVMLL